MMTDPEMTPNSIPGLWTEPGFETGQETTRTLLTTSMAGYSLALCLDIPLAPPLKAGEASGPNGGYSPTSVIPLIDIEPV